jgi:hypothetical protein
MRRISKTRTARTKRPAYPTRKQLDERRAWAESFDRCFVCGDGVRWGLPLEVHEIASRAQAPGKWADVRNYMLTCRMCHEDVLSWLCEAAQLALKSETDPLNYERVFINRIRGRADNAIAESEVRLWCKFFTRRAIK